MEAVDGLLSELPDVDGSHEEVIACLAAFRPAERRILVDTLLHDMEALDMRMHCIRVVESLFEHAHEDPASGAEPLIRAFGDKGEDAVGMLEMYDAFPKKRWRELFTDLELEARSRLVSHFGEMTKAEKLKLGETSSSLLPMRVLLQLLDNPPSESCSLCRDKRAYKKQFLMCQNLDADPASSSESQQFVPNLYRFEATEEHEPSTLSQLGLEDGPECVYYDAHRVDTATLCRGCKKEVYDFMGNVGNDREIYHLVGRSKLRELQMRHQHDARRARWWTFESYHRQLAATLAVVHAARRGARERAFRADRRRRDADAARREATRRADERECRHRMIETALATDPKWRSSVEKDVSQMLEKRTIYSALQFSKKDGQPLQNPRPKLWTRAEVRGGGISSQKRELSDSGVPLTADEASVVFGTRVRVVVDETDELRRDKMLAVKRQAERDEQRAMFSKHSHDVRRSCSRHELEQWRQYSSLIEESRRRREAREEHAREQRRLRREEERARLRRLREELRQEGQKRADDECRAVQEMREIKGRELEQEANERLAMMLAETEQCAIDCFWGIPTESRRLRRLEEMQRLIWMARIELCNEVMRKTESVEPFFTDELERRKPPALSSSPQHGLA